MEINLIKRIVILTWLLCSYGMLNAQSWSKSFTAGGYDSNNNFLGGSEVLQLVNHKNMLFASVGYWEDENNIWYGGFNNNIGWGQINRLDNPSASWQEDLFMGANHLRPEILKQLVFTKDQFGSPLASPDTVLIAAGYSPNYITSQVVVKSFVRNDLNGTWGESEIVQGGFPAGENYSIRDIEIYVDQQTGLEYVFTTVGTQGIYKGKYNPAIPGKIDWISTAEFGPLSIRPLGIEVANGALYFSSGSKLYRRIDGVSPSYVIDHDFSDLGATINSAVGGIRGLTTIDNPSGLDDAFLLMWCPDGQSQGTIWRLEPDGIGGFNRIYETKLSVMIESFLSGSTASYVLGAYNEFYKYVDPISNDTLHLVGFEANISGGGHPLWNGYYKGGLFAKRASNGQYSIEEINGTIGANDTALVANRCYVASPFPGESAVYFGGFDPNSNTSTNMAWVFKKDYLVNAVDDIALNENNFIIYPNPSSKQLFIKSENLEDYEYNIISLLGKKVATGKINGQTEAVDISSLPPNVYVLIIANEAVKFIKTN
ncbi:MAG: T9SS type A sorting domain-containing protein [Crocinitomicaceae bacterium]|nr:T9SS type A sorting domain-containing protein [Crocinitomicaceae bacterium]